ncbi:MAG: hypothetical protein HDS85_02295 [Bacteroidales bacterium]|nr:hypothetical protein [Bacteroidales bacterium]
MSSSNEKQWYALRSHRAFALETPLSGRCDEVFFPKETSHPTEGPGRLRAIIPHVMFFHATESEALSLETESQREPASLPTFRIYRNIKGDRIQPIPESQIRLLKLLTANDTERCEIYSKTDFKRGTRVRVTGGIYAGYTGYVQRVKKNKHVLIEIEGVCMVLLPFIHPDLLEVLPPDSAAIHHHFYIERKLNL